MPEGDGLYSKDRFFLALKGRVVVRFVDGTTLEGDYVTQDELNVFLTVGQEPVMIPRSQIKFIQGKQGQPIERDTSQAAFLQLASARPETIVLPPTPSEEPAPQVEAQEPAEEVAPVPVEAVEQEEEEDEGTLVLPREEEVTPGVPAQAVKESAGPESVESTDLTFVLGDAAMPQEAEAVPANLPVDKGVDEDDATYIFAKEVEKPAAVSARLVCSSGPHAGDVFPLSGGLLTLGRSVDSNIALTKDKEISRRHAIIVQEDDGFFIQDQNSLNGTFVNNELIKGSHYLKEGDIILVGLTTLEYHNK